ncbi:MAG: hypothetical protein JM58_09120 [Peptococcaceae bacterium BICA1-8]|nr:MAG: hypothetical protein JM58_09120 [Peptococcaceae bacterium BICA1-8]
MIKGAMQFLMDKAALKEQIIEIGGKTFSTKNLELVTTPNASPLTVNTLSGLTDYICSGFDNDTFAGNLIHIVGPAKVNLISNLLEDSSRETYMTTEAMTPVFRFGQWYDIESFIIALQSSFVKNLDVEKILRLVGNIEEKAIRTFTDDGISQGVAARTGLAKVDEVVVPNPVLLAPYRSFIEIEQPESNFVFRLKQGKEMPECALFEADGGAWKLEAMKRIKEYLDEQLKDMDIKVIS